MKTEESKLEAQREQLDIPVVSKRIELSAAEIAFTIKILQWNIDFAPEENTQNEIDLTTSILQKLIM